MTFNLSYIKCLINAEIIGNISDLSAELSCSNITSHSKEVNESTLFVAIKGTKVDGHVFLGDVCKKTKMVVVENEKAVPTSYDGIAFKVPSSKKALALLCHHFYSPEVEKMVFYGVTGTNGKTSTTYIIESLLNYLNVKVGVLGTNNHRLGAKVWESQLTTPGPIKLHKRLNEMQEADAHSIAMEVSSHALDQGRVDGLLFDVAIFTNLTLDHLDYHENLEDYFLAKRKLFSQRLRKNAVSVVNGDDSHSHKIIPSEGKRYSFGLKEHNDFVFKIEYQSFAGCQVELLHQNKSYKFLSPLVGLHNVYNVVGSLVALWSQGYLITDILDAIKNLPVIPGRLESVLNSFGINVFVDYAHTDDALKQVLQVLGKIKKNIGLGSKVITVFGCGGDRDKTKRPLMFKAASENSDVVIITSDNPRTEEPYSIINDILTDNKEDKETIFIEEDRETAIKMAVKMCKDNDILLIAGKGHEDYQIIGQKKYPFSDHKIVKEALSGL